MNLRHFRTLIWLRWRLALADLRKLGIASRILVGLLTAFAVVASLGGFFVALLVGVFGFPDAKPIHLLVVFDGFVVAFLFFWLIGFLAELQRGESLSLQKLLHLPISLRGAFLLNYAGSFVTLTMVMFLPVLLALGVALVITHGWRMLGVFPLLAGFLLLVTSVTYLVRGWLGSIMDNPKRRRTVVMFVTIGVILFFQLPGLSGMWFGNQFDDDETRAEYRQQLHALVAERDAEQTPEDRRRALTQEIDQLTADYESKRQANNQQTLDTVRTWGIRVNIGIPFGWFPYGTYRLAEGTLIPCLLGSLGLFGLTAACLQWSFRSTVRHYRDSRSSRKSVKTSRRMPTGDEPARTVLDTPFPWLPSQSGMVAKTNLHNLIRTPAVKMQLIAPLIVPIMMGFVASTTLDELGARARLSAPPIIAIALLVMVHTTLMGVALNQFGYDGHAFRAYMLLPITGRDWLLGKNASLFPIFAAASGIAIGISGFLFPMTPFDLMACVLMSLASFLAMLIIGNFVSTRFPVAVPTSAMKKPKPDFKTVLAHLAVLFVFPFFYGPLAAPIALQAACRYFDWLPWLPVGFVLELLALTLTAWIYYALLPAAGRYLKNREKHVLETVTQNLK